MAVQQRTLVVILVVGLVASGTIVFLGAFYAPAPTSPPAPVVNATLSMNHSGTAVHLSPTFLGVNLRADFQLGGAQGNAVAATSAHLVRWPGGAIADRYDVLAQGGQGILYSDSGRPSTPATSAGQFVTWCKSIGCTAIIQVPGEINDPSYAASEVSFFEHALGFAPAYWEIGDEPALWAHFGVPWSQWAPNQTAPPSPVMYSQQVHAYVAALRGADPGAHIIGLPGVGQGASTEPAWISAVVSANGANLSAVAIHVYPAGPGTGNGTLAQFLDTVYSSGGIPPRLSADQQAIHSACSKCRIGILVDELAAATQGGWGGFLSSFPVIPYEATEAIQGMQGNATGLVFWVSQYTYAGSWIDPSNHPRPVYTLFTNFLSGLPSVLASTNLTEQANGLSVALLENGSKNPGVFALLAANTNSSVAFRLSFSGIFPPTAPATAESWSATESAPAQTSWTAGAPSSWVLPPVSVLVLRVGGPALTAVGASAAPTFLASPTHVRISLGLHLPLLAITGLTSLTTVSPVLPTAPSARLPPTPDRRFGRQSSD